MQSPTSSHYLQFIEQKAELALRSKDKAQKEAEKLETAIVVFRPERTVYARVGKSYEIT